MNSGIKSKVKKTNYLLILTLVIFIFSLLLLRPYHLKTSDFLYSGDDEGYFAHTTSLVFFEFPSYEKEYWQGEGNYPAYGIGPAIMSYPFTASFSVIDRLIDSSIIEVRNRQNIEESWTLFGFFLSTYFFFYIGLVLLYFGLNHHFDAKTSFFAVLFLILFQYAPLYVFRRPVFSHIYEFTLQSIFVFLLLKNLKTGFLKNASKKIVVLTGLLAGLIFLVRYNNILFTIIWPIILFCFKEGKFDFKNNWSKLLLCYLISISVIMAFRLIPAIYYNDIFGQGNYISSVNNRLIVFKDILFYAKRLFHIFFWYDWGLLFTAPLAIIGISYLFRVKRGVRLSFILILLPLLLNLYIVISWGTQGGWYGYRYIIFSLVPIVVFPFAAFIKDISDKIGYKTLLIILVLVSIFPIISMLAFEGIDPSLSLSRIEQYFGISGWGNNTYQLEIWKILFTEPKVFLATVSLGFPLYFINLFAFAFNLHNSLPGQLINVYPEFRLIILVKTIIIYIFPFIMYFIIVGIQNRRLNSK